MSKAKLFNPAGTGENLGGAYDEVPRERNTYPRDNAEFTGDLDRLIDEFILDRSRAAFFDKNTRFFTQGSCFAENLHKALTANGYRSFYNEKLEAMNSPLANSVYLWKLAKRPEEPAYKELQAAEVFIFTVGVAPCWFRRADGEFVYAPDLKYFEHFVQRTVTVAQAKQALVDAFACIRQINPSIQIVATLSPVPLSRTFDFRSAIVADAVSKSTLRAALHEVIQEVKDSRLLYFPSFEIVRWAGGHRGDAFGDDGAPRHVSKHYADAIIRAFIRLYEKPA